MAKTPPVDTVASIDRSAYRTTIGLEIHAELRTATKMFCACTNDPDEKRPNHHVCPVCMGHPGTLPVINKKAVEHVIRVGMAVGGTIADYTEFDRKNYFYPDIPKGYQISQFTYPLVKGGSLAGVALTRIHLEEDTASSNHETNGNSLIDFNRSSVPLMELVTEPVIHTAAEAGTFARELQLLLQYLGVAEANMEKGEMRVEANISVSPTETFGTKVEVKNLNSFKSVERAIAYEVERHIDLIKSGEKVVQETRGFDEKTGTTFSQRKKEDSHDYRYFPDPDLPKLRISEIPDFAPAKLEEGMHETPAKRRIRYARDYSIKAEDIEFYITHFPTWSEYFERAAGALTAKNPKVSVQTLSNFIRTDIAGYISKSGQPFDEVSWRLTPDALADIVLLYDKAELSSRGAKDAIILIAAEGGDAREVAERQGLLQKNDAGAIETAVKEIIAAHPDVVKEYKGGKAASLQFLIGQAMKKTKGSANPAMLKESFESMLAHE